MAPEIFDRDYHWEADMWSLGIMLYQLYARRFPFWRTYEECRHAKLDEVAALVAGGCDEMVNYMRWFWWVLQLLGRVGVATSKRRGAGRTGLVGCCWLREVAALVAGRSKLRWL
jgi:hypothetical protein